MLTRQKWMKGQSLVELALALPFLALVLGLVITFSQVFYASIGVASAARAGVQYGAQKLTTAIDYTGMENAALSDGQNISGLSATASSFCQCATATGANSCSCDGSTVSCSSVLPSGCLMENFVQVTANATVNTFTFPGVPNTFPLKYTAVMQVND